MTIFEGVRDGTTLEGTFYTRVQNWRDTLRSGAFTARDWQIARVHPRSMRVNRR